MQQVKSGLGGLLFKVNLVLFLSTIYKPLVIARHAAKRSNAAISFVSSPEITWITYVKFKL